MIFRQLNKIFANFCILSYYNTLQNILLLFYSVLLHEAIEKVGRQRRRWLDGEEARAPRAAPETEHPTPDPARNAATEVP